MKYEQRWTRTQTCGIHAFSSVLLSTVSLLTPPKTPSQNDLWCMLLTDSWHVSVAIEAKAGEDFDRRLGDWLVSEGEGKTQRLEFLCRILDLAPNPDRNLRYQLFHRTASAILEARRWRVGKALMLVQSFKESRTSWQDYVDFAAQFHVAVSKGSVSGQVRVGETDLYLGWVESPLATDAIAVLAV
jgi:hypothetical protein